MIGENEVERIVQAVLKEMGFPAGPSGDPVPAPPVLEEEDAGFAELSGPGFMVPDPLDRELMENMLSTTPARLGVWRAGPRYRTDTMLRFRADHAAAMDAVFNDVSQEFLERLGFFTVQTLVRDKDEYLTRPDLGRRLSEEAEATIRSRCVASPQVLVIAVDGLSSRAVEANLSDLYQALRQSLEQEGLRPATPFFVKYGRVAVMNHIGEILQPEVVVELIGERPGLATAESMSAYLCYRPRLSTLESERTVISNIHRRGSPPVEVGAHLGGVVRRMLETRSSGVGFTV